MKKPDFIKIKKNPVIVLWEDAMDRERMSLQKAIKKGLSLTESLGYLVYQGKKFTLLCYFYDVEDEESHDFTVIPTNCIKKITKLK